MLTFLKLGTKGRLGNQLFQIASTIGLARQFGHDFAFPKWQYAKYFDINFRDDLPDRDWKILNEEYYHFYDFDIPSTGDFSIDGWLQTELYFDTIDVKSIFKFNQQFESRLLHKYRELFSKPTILITIRRGDFVGNPIFFQLSNDFYHSALLEYFQNIENYNIVFASDDIDYCRYHFSFLSNSFFLDGLTAIEQLCLASKCDNYIISNSTFSWWLARLGEGETSKIICPQKNFALDITHDDKDYFSQRWVKHAENHIYSQQGWLDQLKLGVGQMS